MCRCICANTRVKARVAYIVDSITSSNARSQRSNVFRFMCGDLKAHALGTVGNSRTSWLFSGSVSHRRMQPTTIAANKRIGFAFARSTPLPGHGDRLIVSPPQGSLPTANTPDGGEIEVGILIDWDRARSCAKTRRHPFRDRTPKILEYAFLLLFYRLVVENGWRTLFTAKSGACHALAILCLERSLF